MSRTIPRLTGNAPIPAEFRGGVVALGNFDGVHIGHQALIKKLIAESKKRNLTPSVMTFEPHPKEFFISENAPSRLTTLREKLEFFLDYGIEKVFVNNAFDLLGQGQTDLHDAAIRDAVKKNQRTDLIVFTQFSMASAFQKCQEVSSVPIFSAPIIAVQTLQKRITHER